MPADLTNLSRPERLERVARRAAVLVDGEPQSKGGNGRRGAPAFRAAALEQAGEQPGWPNGADALAVGLSFWTTRRQPPHLAQLPKHYLDLLGGAGPAGPQQPVLFADDRQVKLLHAAAFDTWAPSGPDAASDAVEGSVAVRACTLADAVADLRLAGVVRRGRGEEIGDGADAGEDMREENERELRTAKDLEDRGGAVGLRTAALLRHRCAERAQAAALRFDDDTLRLLVLEDPAALLLGRQAASTARLEALKGMLRPISLPPLPAAPGDGAARDQLVEEALAAAVEARAGLFPLVVPVRATFLVIPPASRAGGDKDLDNVVRGVLGRLEKAFTPPRAPFTRGPLWEDPDAAFHGMGPHIEAWALRTRARQKSIGDTAVWSYQALELARGQKDPPEGSVSIVLGHGENMHSVWDEADRYLAEHFDEED